MKAFRTVVLTEGNRMTPGPRYRAAAARHTVADDALYAINRQGGWSGKENGVCG